MKNYAKIVTWRIPPVETVFPFDDDDGASIALAWRRANEAARELTQTVDGKRLVPRVVVWRKPSVDGPWRNAEEVAR